MAFFAQARESSSREELQMFYDAMMPRLRDLSMQHGQGEARAECGKAAKMGMRIGLEPARQGRRSLLRDLFAVTTIGLLAVAVACLTASSAKAFPGDLAQAPLAQKPTSHRDRASDAIEIFNDRMAKLEAV